MPHFTIKRLPAGFSFPLSKRSIKDGLGEYIDLFRKIEISGISYSERSPTTSFLRRYWAGILTANNDGGWSFDLQIEGLRDENLFPYKEHVRDILIRDINSFVAEKLGSPETSPPEPRQLFLAYSIEGSSIKSSSHKVVKDK